MGLDVKKLQEELTVWLEAHQEEMFADIASLVEIPSVCQEDDGGYPYGTHCAEALCQMGRLADRYGFEWQNHDWHAVSVRYGSGSRQLGIWGHLDVVPVGEGWLYQPFECKKVKNFLLGRGTQDNKGPDIGSLYILRYLKEHDIVPPFEIRLIYGCQEESGMQDVVEYLKREAAPDLSFVPDCGFPVCCGEKGFLGLELTSGPLGEAVQELSGGQAANAIPGKACAVIAGEKIQVEGIGGHSAYPDGCVNALGLLGHKCMEHPALSQAAQQAFAFLASAGNDGYGKTIGMARGDEISGPMTCVPTLLRLENGCMIVTVNIRYHVTGNSEEILADFRKVAASCGLTVKMTTDSKPNWQNPNAPWPRYLTEVYADVMGQHQEPYTMGGGTYARKIPNAVGFGPGLPKDLSVLGLPDGHGECHQPDESQCIDTLFQAWKIYMTTVLRLIETGLPLQEQSEKNPKTE